MNKVKTGAGQQSVSGETLPNGPGAAAILAAGIGSAALGVFALAGDAIPAISTAAVVVWLVALWGLARRRQLSAFLVDHRRFIAAVVVPVG